ncbi:MAG: HU family DNA-binding protein [Aquificaceae bacterium]
MRKKLLLERLWGLHSPRYSKKKVNSMVNFLLEMMKEGINSEEGLRISGFGSFKRRRYRVIFKLSKMLNYRLKGSKM